MSAFTTEHEASHALRLHRLALAHARRLRAVDSPAHARRHARGLSAYHLDVEARDARARLAIVLRLSRRGGVA